jgi:hypothetical protein
VTHLVGAGLDGALALLLPLVDNPATHSEASPEREAVLAALNGVLGDRLYSAGNPLAQTMALRQGGRVLPLAPAALKAQLAHAPAAAAARPVHERQAVASRRPGPRRMLARRRRLHAVYLHCNTGLHISINGRALAQQMEPWWTPGRAVQRIVLLGHSMGGLIARSAVHQGARGGPPLAGAAEADGLPGHAAPRRAAGACRPRGGPAAGAAPYARPLARLGQVRSAGITDLRHGLLLDEDWAGRDRFAAASALRLMIENWHISDFHVSEARPSQEEGFAEHLSTRGDNLPLVANFLFEHHPKAFARILDAMKARVPGVSLVEPRQTEDGRLVLRFQDGSFKDPFIARHVSDGTIKMFAYLVLLNDPQPYPLLAVEEPENQLYPELLPELAEEFRAMRAVAGRCSFLRTRPIF